MPAEGDTQPCVVVVVSRPHRTLWLAVALALGLALLAAQGVPRIPAEASEVLVRSNPTGGVRPPARKPPAEVLRDPVAAAAEARKWIEVGRSELDTRALGRAQALLQPWWFDVEPSPEIRLLRATLRQSLHDFPSAITDLVAVVRVEPRNAQAWLLLSTLHTVRGNFSAAREAALQLAPLTGHLTGTAAAASVASVNGQLEDSYDLLKAALLKDRRAPVSIRLWSLTLLGEMADRLGRGQDAEAHFKQALGLGLHDAYLLGAYADHLLSSSKAAEAIPLLDPHLGPDSLLLRRALAEQFVHPGSEKLKALKQTLSARFDASRARGEALHQREEARFALSLLGQPLRALELARLNWQIQREPADLKILVDAALAAGHAQTLAQVREWLAASSLEDHAIRRRLESDAAAR